MHPHHLCPPASAGIHSIRPLRRPVSNANGCFPPLSLLYRRSKRQHPVCDDLSPSPPLLHVGGSIGGTERHDVRAIQRAPLHRYCCSTNVITRPSSQDKVIAHRLNEFLAAVQLLLLAMSQKMYGILFYYFVSHLANLLVSIVHKGNPL